MNPTFQASVCIDAVLADYEIDRALALVVESGLPAFEFWAWWNRDLDALCRARDRSGLHVAACCTKFISLVDPALREAYLDGLRESIAAADVLGCRALISQVGDERAGVPRDEQRASLVEGLRQAAPLLEEAGVTLVIEPLNVLVNHPGYYLVRSDEAFAIVDEVDSPCVKVVYDIYHQQISEGHLIETITANINRIAHFHAAGNPGRHELDHGEIHYPAVFEAIRQSGYKGFVGLEYWPLDDPSSGLRQVASWFHHA